MSVKLIKSYYNFAQNTNWLFKNIHRNYKEKTGKIKSVLVQFNLDYGPGGMILRNI